MSGLNFKISALAYVGGICHGAREDVIIYQDLNGDYSVTDWGTRYNCDQVDADNCNAV